MYYPDRPAAFEGRLVEPNFGERENEAGPRYFKHSMALALDEEKFRLVSWREIR